MSLFSLFFPFLKDKKLMKVRFEDDFIPAVDIDNKMQKIAGVLSLRAK